MARTLQQDNEGGTQITESSLPLAHCADQVVMQGVSSDMILLKPWVYWSVGMMNNNYLISLA